MGKLSKILRLWLAIVLIFGWTGCGSDGGSGSNNSDAQSEPVVQTIKEENDKAIDFTEQTISYFDAVEEYFETLETESGGIDLTGMTVEDLVGILGQEQVDALAQNLFSIYDQTIEPSGEALQAAYDALVLAEQEYENYLDPEAGTMVQPAGLLTVGAVCAAGGILLTGMGTIVSCVQEVLKEQRACIDGYIQQGYSEDVAGLACTLQNPEAIKRCGIEVATSYYTTALSAGAKGYKMLQYLIDALSAYDAGTKIKALFGERGCSSSQGVAYPYDNDGAFSSAETLNPEASYFFGSATKACSWCPKETGHSWRSRTDTPAA